MAVTTRSYSARSGGKFARFRCAGAPRNEGIGWGRMDERSAASMGHSDRISECREVVQTHLLRDSTQEAFLRAVAGLDLGTQGSDVDVPLWKLSPNFHWNPSDSRQTDGFHIICRWSERRSGVEESCALSPFGSAEEEHAGFGLFVAKARSAKKSWRNVRSQGGSRPLLQSVNRSHGRVCWHSCRARSQWSCSHSNTRQFEPCDAGDSVSSDPLSLLSRFFFFFKNFKFEKTS